MRGPGRRGRRACGSRPCRSRTTAGLSRALDGFTLDVPAGETVALVGPTGAGKTTAAHLLLRFIEPDGGRILVDDVPLAALTPEEWRLRVAWVPQHPRLFHGTVRENLLLARPDASDADIDRALELARLEDLVRALPRGLDTPVGEGGERLSGGEAQRLALARAWLKDAPVLVLDEPTAQLDLATEAAVVEAIGRLRRGRTVLLVAHRLTTVAAADRVALVSQRPRDRGGRPGSARGLGPRVPPSPRRVGRGALSGPWRRLLVLARPERRRVSSPCSCRCSRSPPASASWARPRGCSRRPRSTRRLPPSRSRSSACGRSGCRAPSSATASGSRLTTSRCGCSPACGWRSSGPSFPSPRHGSWPTAGATCSAGSSRTSRRSRASTCESSARACPRSGRGRSSALLLGSFSGALPLAAVLGLAARRRPRAAPLLPARRGARAAGWWLFAASSRPGSWTGCGAPPTCWRSGARAITRPPWRRSAARRRSSRRASRRPRPSEAPWRSSPPTSPPSPCWRSASSAIGAGQLDGVHLATVALLTLASFEAVAPLPLAWHDLGAVREASRRLFDLVDAPPAVAETCHAAPAPVTGAPLVEVRDLRFTYPGEPRPALDGVSLRLDPGRRIAIVGPSGSGKSTLAHLLLRFWDAPSGSILLDGHDLGRLAFRRHTRPDRLRGAARSRVHGNPAREPAPGSTRASDDELRAVLRAVRLDALVERLPRGLDAWVGEAGQRLSGGERQRLALARALLRPAPLLLLDEPTAHLDALTEREVLAEILRAGEGRATLLVTHRLVSLDAFDEVLVLDRGRVAERGRAAELLASGGILARLLALQRSVDVLDDRAFGTRNA